MTDQERLKHAEIFAEKKHRGQLRKGGDPYITHPAAVAKKVREEGYGIDYQITAWFHDLLEDTDATEEEIASIGGERVLEAVKLLTKEKGYIMADYIARIRADEMAFAVKKADRLHNLQSAYCTDIAFREYYIRQTREWYSGFSEEIMREADTLEQSVIREKKRRKDMTKVVISESIRYVGVDDREIDLFESQYVVPNGVSYNSYLILDEKTALMDTVDARKTEEWLTRVEEELAGKTPDYLIISHLEPDHSGSILAVTEKYPDMKLVSNAKLFAMLPQFFDIDTEGKKVVVAEGDTLELGSHTLHFVMAPMVHWPEVMVEYESTEKVLFSADAFGKFGALDTEEDWACEARRYYFNIVGKYGMQAAALLKKAANLEIEKICPLHGPVLQENLAYYLDKYTIWSSYEAEDDGVMVAYASIHGNTAKAAKELAGILEKKGAKKVVVCDLAREDMAEAVEDAFRYDKLIVCSATYDGGLFPVMQDFLYHLKHKNYQNKKVGFMENGSWAPVANRKMKEFFEGMKNMTLCENEVSIRSVMKDTDREPMEALAAEILS